MSGLLGAQIRVAKLSEERFEIGELVIPAKASPDGPTVPDLEGHRRPWREHCLVRQSTVVYSQATGETKAISLIRVGVL